MDATKERDTEHAMLTAIKAGDMPAWDDFLKQYDQLICSIVAWKKWHFSTELREDVAQKIRSDLLKSIPAFEGKSSLDHYVKTICVRCCISAVRRQARERETFVPSVVQNEDGTWKEVDFASDAIDEPVAAVIMAERIEGIRRLFGELQSVCQTIIRQFFMENHSYKKMAELNEISIKTVGSRLARCLEKLRVITKESPQFMGEFSD